MVTSATDCINVPDQFPNILKSYVKDVVRTQPYDLLRWSATYFRCIANEVNPPVKCRLERDKCQSQLGSLTTGFLRTLVKQLGKGYFVNRDVLQQHWEGLCLPQDELWKYLSICRMLHWDQVDWLRVFAVMAGTLTQDFRSTIELVCELLTDEPEGGPNPIPLWIFVVCYSYLAELDCGERQEFRNGRKILEYGELEPHISPTIEPATLSAISFRETIANEWKNCVEFKLASSEQKEKIIHEPFEHQISSNILKSRLSSDVKFGNYCDAIKQSVEFESIISILSDVEDKQQNKSMNLAGVNSASTVTSDTSDDDEFEVKLSLEEKAIITEIGAPWSWMHYFATQTSDTKSYNFLEKPIDSDVDASKITTNQREFACAIPPIPGIGGLISITTAHQFINHLKIRSKDENGMVFPRHFNERNCPQMIDE